MIQVLKGIKEKEERREGFGDRFVEGCGRCERYRNGLLVLLGGGF